MIERTRDAKRDRATVYEPLTDYGLSAETRELDQLEQAMNRAGCKTCEECRWPVLIDIYKDSPLSHAAGCRQGERDEELRAAARATRRQDRERIITELAITELPAPRFGYSVCPSCGRSVAEGTTTAHAMTCRLLRQDVTEQMESRAAAAALRRKAGQR
jgi:hypothetical protein